LYQLIAGLEDVAMRTKFGLGDRASVTANEFVFLQSRKPVEAKYDAPSKKGKEGLLRLMYGSLRDMNNVFLIRMCSTI
jgi:hypothetical protein